MKLSFEKARWTMDMDGTWLCLKVGKDAAKFIDKMKPGKTYEAELKEKKKKRSLDANAYFWVLCGKLAAKVGLTKEEVYRELIRDIGDNYEILPIRDHAVQKWIEVWGKHGIGWVCEVLGRCRTPGYTNVIAYYGSSTYDTAQMSALINLTVHECKQQGIETMTPQELRLLLESWDGKKT